MRRRKSWLHDISEELPQMVWTADAHGVKTFCNRRYLQYTGAESVSAMNSSWQSFIHPDDRVGVARQWFHSLDTGAPYCAEYRLLRRDGTYRHFSAAALPICDRAGRISSWLSISKDVHEDKLAEQLRNQATALAFVHRLAASMAHEINNPLESLTNAIYLALDGRNLDQSTREYLSLAEQELRRLTHVTSHALRFHRQVATPAFEDVSVLMEAAVAAYDARLQSASIAVNQKYKAKTKLFCLGQDVRQVFDHLVRNALDAMPAEGKLRLRIRSTSDRKDRNKNGIIVTVADNGTGIKAELRKHLFEPFFSTKCGLRAGLGLWATQQIVRKHNGWIRFRSRTGAVDHGTVFRVFFPFAGLAGRDASHKLQR
jgi:PAS domain S-box-containing protein